MHRGLMWAGAGVALAVLVWLQSRPPTAVESLPDRSADDASPLRRPVLMPGRPASLPDGEQVSEEADDEVDAQAVGGARFDVRMSNKQRATHATLRFGATRRATHFGEPVPWSPESEALHLEPKQRYVVAESDGWVSDPLAVQANGASVLMLKSGRGGSLVGQVGVPYGMRIDEVLIRLHPVASASVSAPATARDNHSQRDRYGSVTHGDYGFKFNAVKPGLYWVFVWHRRDGVFDDAALITINDRQIRRDLEISIDDVGPLAPVRVFDPNGQLMESDHREIKQSWVDWNSGVGFAGIRAMSADGVPLLGTRPESGASRGLHVHVRTLQYGSMFVDVEPLRTDPIDIHFQPAVVAVFRFQARERLPKSLRSLRVALHRRRGTTWFPGCRAELDDKGVAKLMAQPGQYELMLTGRGPKKWHGSGVVTVARFPVAVRTQSEEVVLEVPSLHQVEVQSMHKGGATLVKREDGFTWTHQGVGYWPRVYNGETPTDGYRLTFPAVPSGQYEVRYRVGDEERTVSLRVPEQLAITLK